MGKALGRQVGGNHYQGMAPQPVEVFVRWAIPYCEANAIKYLIRWRDKGGIQDLEKAVHYCELAIEGRNVGWFSRMFNIFKHRFFNVHQGLVDFVQDWARGIEMGDAVYDIAMSLQEWDGNYLYVAIKKIKAKIDEEVRG